jgi:hypothetical protein
MRAYYQGTYHHQLFIIFVPIENIYIIMPSHMFYHNIPIYLQQKGSGTPESRRGEVSRAGAPEDEYSG